MQPERIESNVPIGALLDVIDHPVAGYDVRLGCVYANPAFEALVGLERAELLHGQPPFSYWPASKQAAYSALFRSWIGAGDCALQLSFDLETPSGRRRNARFRAFRVATPGNGGSLHLLTVTPEAAALSSDHAAQRIRRLEEGLSRIAAEVSLLRQPSVRPTVGIPGIEGLSGRESEVLEQLFAGRPVDGIASELFISRHTVRNHLKSIFRKLGVHSQRELVSLGYQCVTTPSNSS